MLGSIISWKLSVLLFVCLSMSKSHALCPNCKNGVDWSEGCEAGWYGVNCGLQCKGKCKENMCDVETGRCSICKVGLYGHYCNQTFPNNCDNTGCARDGGCHKCLGNDFYGGLCNEPCNDACVGCFQKNGTCISCQTGLYGIDCAKPCSDKCAFHECDMQGHCKMGCNYGKFYGSDCDLECTSNITNCLVCISPHGTPECLNCINGKYGKTCENICPANCESCGSSEKCSGCKPGFFGQICDIECSSYITNCMECNLSHGILECLKCGNATYGKNCEKGCPANCEACFSSKKCTQCFEGYSGILCDCLIPNCIQCDINGFCEKCEPGYFGEQCEYACPDCKTCEAGNSKSMPNCISCNEGFFKTDTFCLPCAKSCIQCSSMTECSECKLGLYGQACDIECSSDITNCVDCISSNGTLECLNCSNATYGKNCEKDCPANCETCVSAQKCTKCSYGFVGNVCDCLTTSCLQCYINGFCEKCEPGYFGVLCELTCPDCKTCEAKNGTPIPVCLSCYDGFFKNDTVCLPCPKSCSQCTSMTECSGCKPGFYGQACANECSPNCEPDSTAEYKCDRQNGMCFGNCTDGYYSDYCMLPCIGQCGSSSGWNGCNKQTGKCSTCMDGYFGDFCTETCGINCIVMSSRDMCDRDTGTCAMCQAGFFGSMCEKACSTNCDGECDQKTGKCEICRSKFYGDYCTKKCPDQCGPAPNKTRIICNPLNAECLYCLPGFHGKRCLKYCENNCALLDNVPDCNKANGHCNECQEGHYGKFCRVTCGHCKGLRCHQHTGHCVDGCKKGWFNVTCTERCSSKCREEDCDWLSEVCLAGCIESYGGQFCDKVMPGEGSPSLIPIIVIGVTVPVIFILLAVIVFYVIR